MRKNYLSGVEWEDYVGYSRALKIKNHIFVSGTTATDENSNIVGIDNHYRQTIQCVRNIEKALLHFDSSLSDVVRTRMFVTDISMWKEYGRAHGEIFREIKPVTSMIEINRLIDNKMLIEMEAEAIVEI